MITTSFEYPVGTETQSRSFPKNALLHLRVKTAGASGVGEPGVTVRMELTGIPAPLFQELQTDWNPFGGTFGVVQFDVQLPNVDTQATLKLTAHFPIQLQDPEVVKIPIGVGNVIPLPVPTPEADTGGIIDSIKWIVIAVIVVVLAIYLIPLLIKKGVTQ
jgi:hypothetical protein